jgi:hypothetical protein
MGAGVLYSYEEVLDLLEGIFVRGISPKTVQVF